ncbi:hypothetical protein [Grimontia marina]|uniref:Uncharacterized protein n=1 Tax=Grimontia marina TaxID=646534 RepID=A0A128EY32_9GAMM|nr:hypothetical protein [Grimontia marina]CZF79489.1 hypothetical protein GMA8713_00997 [Grimontia marina]
MEQVNHQYWIDKIRNDLGLKKDPNRKQGCPDLRYSDRFQRAAKRMMQARRMGGAA